MKNTFLVVTGIGLGLLAAVLAFGSADRRGIPLAEAQGAGAAGANGTVLLATGGAAPNLNDLLWILSQDKTEKQERWMLCCYRVENGKLFDLIDIREVTYDMKGPAQLNIKGHNSELAPQAIKDALEKDRKKREEDAKKHPNAGGGNGAPGK